MKEIHQQDLIIKDANPTSCAPSDNALPNHLLLQNRKKTQEFYGYDNDTYRNHKVVSTPYQINVVDFFSFVDCKRRGNDAPSELWQQSQDVATKLPPTPPGRNPFPGKQKLF